MDYNQTLQYIYSIAPMFQQVGAAAYKEGLDGTLALDEIYGHPHRAFKTVHVAGTNGKGSTSHTIAAVLQQAGYRVGLYTSPHLKDFAERIRVNGVMIDHQYVVDFVEKAKDVIETLRPSFFELTTEMAFCWFREQKVDVAVIEVGLGGRLDCTNIITPVVSIITNISFDHMKQLGNTLEQIASEKAGIIKPGVPVVIGEADENLRPIYEAKGSPIIFAEDYEYRSLDFELKGECQEKNSKTIQAALEVLKLTFDISEENIASGFANVVELTGLQGRWQTIGEHPLIIADTAHNEGGMKYIVHQLSTSKYKTLRIVFGMVNDKDISAVLCQMPKDAVYYFTNAAIPRALPASDLRNLASTFGLEGACYDSVKSALDAAKRDSSSDDMIYVGGSNFIVAEVV